MEGMKMNGGKEEINEQTAQEIMIALWKEGFINGKPMRINGQKFFKIIEIYFPVDLEKILHLIAQKYEFPYWQIREVVKDLLKKLMVYWGFE